MTLLNFAPAVSDELASSNAPIVVTGAGGWLGLATLEMLEQALGAAFDQRVIPFASGARSVMLRSGRSVRLHDLHALETLSVKGAAPVIAHYAFLTREKVKTFGAPDYIRINRDLTFFVAGQARRLGATGVFSTSSGAVYRRDGSLESDIVQNPYGVLKLEEEEAFARLRRENGARAALCRVFSVAGPYLNKEYAIGSLIEAALFDERIHVLARQKVYRSFAHVADIVSVGFSIMLGASATPDRPYDTAGDETVEIGELAERVRRRLGCPSKLIVRGQLTETMGEDRYVGDFADFASFAAAAGVSLASLDEQISDTAAYLKARV